MHRVNATLALSASWLTCNNYKEKILSYIGFTVMFVHLSVSDSVYKKISTKLEHSMGSKYSTCITKSPELE